MNDYKLTVLATPTASEVLEQIGITYTVYGGARPLEINSDEEMMALCNKMISEADDKTIVLATYTELTINDKRLGVPMDKDEAKQMIKLLSGKTHVFTTKLGVGGAGQPVEVVNAKTKVTIKTLDEWEVEGYLSFRDYTYPGAYSPLGKGAFFVRSVNGDFNVIKGMPVFELCGLLERKYGITPVNGKNIWKKGSIK